MLVLWRRAWRRPFWAHCRGQSGWSGDAENFVRFGKRLGPLVWRGSERREAHLRRHGSGGGDGERARLRLGELKWSVLIQQA